jgi:hypothetical protein
MKRTAYYLLLTLLLTAGGTRVWGVEKLPSKLQKLADKAYRHYIARETDQFFEDVRQLKDITEFSDYAREISETIHKAVEEFVGGAEPTDDLTKMCIKMPFER